MTGTFRIVALALCAGCPPVVIPAPDADLVLDAPYLDQIQRLGSAGDVDADGHRDYIIGGQFTDEIDFDVSLGRAVVISGATGQPIWAVTGTEDETLGNFGVDGAGDIDEDGFDDLLILVEGGVLRVYSGRTGAPLRDYPSVPAAFGPRNVGDVNGDGFDDHALRSSGGNYDVHVFSGATGEQIHFIDGFDFFGTALAPAGDVDGDENADIIVGAPDHQSDDGKAYVYSGLTGNLLHEVTGTEFDAELGQGVGAVGDIDLDGFDDFVACAPESDSGGIVSGIVIIYSGLDASVLRTHRGAPGAQFADLVVPLGDVTGDGVSDYAIGTDRRPFTNSDPRGRIHVHSGRTGARLRTYIGEEEIDNFGNQVVVIDLDLDGLGDLVAVASELGPTFNATGRLYAFLTPPEGYLEPADIDDDGAVGVTDLSALISEWGPCPPAPDPCRPDLDGDGHVGVTDLLEMLLCWG